MIFLRGSILAFRRGKTMLRTGLAMRKLQRLLVVGSICGSLTYGWQHAAWWLVVPPLAFSTLILAEDRQIRIRRSFGEVISSGHGRHILGSNLAVLVWNTALNSAIFAAMGMAAALLA
jgi:hypothetical protein